MAAIGAVLLTALLSLLVLPLLVGCALPPGAPATPQRPTFCFGPTTTAEGTWELEAGIVVDPGNYHELPTTWKYGLDATTEVSIAASPLIHANHTSSYGDLGLGWRHRFIEAEGAKPAVAVLATLKLPTADDGKGLGSGEPDAFLALTAGGPFAAGSAFGWVAYAQLGALGVDGETPDLTRDVAFMGTWALDARHGIFAEVSNRQVPETSTNVSQIRVGHAIALRPDFVLDWSIYAPLSDDAPDTQIAFGFTRNFGSRGASGARDAGR